MRDWLSRFSAGLASKAAWELLWFLIASGGFVTFATAAWWYWDFFATAPLGAKCVLVAALLVLLVSATSLAGRILRAARMNPARLWFKFKPWGVAWCAEEFLNVGGDFGDPRLVLMIVHVRNCTNRMLSPVEGYLEHYRSGGRLPARINIDGNIRKAEEIKGIPPKTKFCFIVPFAEMGSDVQQQNAPKLEIGLRDWPSYSFVGKVGRTEIRARFDPETVRQEVNRTLDEQRAAQLAQSEKESFLKEGS